jgi:predicted Zn-dependent protease
VLFRSEFLDECLKLYGPNPALMFSQSVILVNQGKISEAMQKLQTTIDSFPEHGLSLNNLAWLLATQDPQDLERARSYAQRAIATNPKMATFHDTLGTILLELNDWRSAIAELELALSQTPIQKRSKIHAKLARAYESIGDRTLATLHRERSDQIP